MVELPKGFDYKDYPILIVDDDEALLAAFADEFSGHFTVFRAEDAGTGLKMIEENREVAVVLADQRMPEITGVEMLGKLKIQHPEITRVLITAYTDIEAAIEAINIGDIFKYISKPYKFEEVKQIIQGGIEKYYLARERRRLQKDEMERLRREIGTENLAALNVLTYGLSHHFKNKLSAAVTFFSMLPEKLKQLIQNMRRGLDKEYWQNYSRTAEEGIKNVVELISDLYAYSSMGEYNFKKVKVSHFLDSEKKVFSSLARGKKIDFQYNLPEELPLVSLDTLRMSQALENIVLNAIQAIPQKGTIKISAEQQKGAVGISIIDNGRGIEKENLKKIFYPFFTTKGPQARGLGLTMADTIIRQHGGQIEVQSQPDQGASVIIKLPIDP